jgi:hypothetical protein
MKRLFFILLMITVISSPQQLFAEGKQCCIKSTCSCVQGECCKDGECNCVGNCCSERECRCGKAGGCMQCSCSKR